MKRWPLIASFVLFIALCASLAYWAMQFLKPATRPVAAPPPAVQAPPDMQAAAALFGGRGKTEVASNFQLKGVVFSGTASDSVAILSADGKPAQAVRANKEIAPGVKVKEVHRRYVVLSDNGVEKRVELPEEKLQVSLGSARNAPVATTPLPARSAPAMPSAMANTPAQAPATAATGATSPAPSAAPGTTGAQNAAPNTGNTGAPASPSAPAASGFVVPQANSPAQQAGAVNNPTNANSAPPAPGMPVQAPSYPQGQQQ